MKRQSNLGKIVPLPIRQALEIIRSKHGAINGIELKGWSICDSLHTRYAARIMVNKKTLRIVIEAIGGQLERFTYVTRREKGRAIQ